MRISWFRLALLSIWLFSTAIFSNSQTIYFKLSAIQDNGVRIEGDNSGIFVTFTDKGCYISDKNGISDNSGFLKFITQNDKSILYRGTSHCGYCTFNVSKDLKLLNISFDETILVYKTAEANGASKSSFCKNYVRNEGSKKSTNNYDNDLIPIENQHGDEHTNPIKKEWVECIVCGGSGKCNSCAGRGYTIVNGTLFECRVCHGIGRCNICHGQKGYKL